METKVKDKQKTTESTNFGPVENTTPIINFKYGIPGFENLSKFVLQDLKNYPPFQLFRSVEEDNLSMIILDTKYLKELDNLKIPRNELRKIGSPSQDEIKTYVILRINPATKQFVANTRAPLIVNKSKHLGDQIIIENQGLRTDYPIEVAQQSSRE